ncbi:hypothetical protein B0T22DRAFT_523566 [Podospora appendiculata]|uniref:Uncharacterized protein n=1 Tax=Podospora appendiculata TaxID=314037 RepID=A0AAE0WZY7_9PEZI|nr:hypothetical protein B0T22DRAFT_523566 [Podospora appendiculata]
MQNISVLHGETSNRKARHVGIISTQPAPIERLPEEIRERICQSLAPLQEFDQRWKHHRWPGYSRVPSYTPFTAHYQTPQHDLRHLALTSRFISAAVKRSLYGNILIPDVPTMAKLLSCLTLSAENARYVRSIQPLFRLNDGINDDETLSMASSLGRALPALTAACFPNTECLQRYQKLLRPRSNSERALGPLQQQELVQTIFLALICLTPCLKTLKLWIPPPGDEQYLYLVASVQAMTAARKDGLTPCPVLNELELDARISEVEVMAENFLPERANHREYRPLLALGEVTTWDIHGLTGEASYYMAAWFGASDSMYIGNIHHLRLAGDVDAATFTFDGLFCWLSNATNLRTLRVCSPFDSRILPGENNYWNTVLRSVANTLESLEIPTVCCNAFRCTHTSEVDSVIPYGDQQHCTLQFHPLRFGPEKRLTHLSAFHNLSSLKVPLRALFGDFRTFDEGTSSVVENQDRMIAAVKWLDLPLNLARLHLIEEHDDIGISSVDEDRPTTRSTGSSCSNSLNLIRTLRGWKAFSQS